MSHRFVTAGAVAAAMALGLGSVLLVAATAAAQAEQIAVVVNGEPITEAEIEGRLKFDRLVRHREPSRQEVVEELIDEKLKLRTARQSGIDVTDADVDGTYAAMAKRMNLTPEQLTGALAHAGVDTATLRHRIRADIAWQRFVRMSRNPTPLHDDPPLREQRDMAPFSQGLEDPAPRKKKADGPSWRE
jgi:peptidyl-prolyl cis-trans isomerase SurA